MDFKNFLCGYQFLATEQFDENLSGIDLCEIDQNSRHSRKLVPQKCRL